MAKIVSILGILMMVIRLVGIALPQIIVGLIEHWRGKTRFWFAVLVRLILGVVLLWAAPVCREPVVVQVVGVISIVAAVCLFFIGQARLDRFIGSWLKRPRLLRPAAVFAVAFGVLLIYAGA